MGLVPTDHVIERTTTEITTFREGSHGSAGYELDSYANVKVSNEQAWVFSKNVLNDNVRVFSDEASRMQGVSIVDCIGCL